MKVRTYTAASLTEAMARIKEDLGGEAVIISSRRVRRQGLRGYLYPLVVEVTAAVEEGKTGGAVEGKDQLSIELASLKAVVSDLASRLMPSSYPEWLKGLHRRLLEHRFTEEAAAKLAERVLTEIGVRGDFEAGLRCLEKTIIETLGRPKVIRPETTRQIAFVGPTGVGKTTTLAKLAARFALAEGLRVAVITADTYRIAAIEQLKTYTEIIGVPLEVVFTPAELREALAKYAQWDLVFIDTAGRSPLNRMQMGEMKGFLEAASPVEVYLLLAATTRYQDALEAAKRYADVGYHRLVFTKLDESTVYGLIPNMVLATRKPLAYFTTGQRVPDDIEEADPCKVADLILRRGARPLPGSEALGGMGRG